MAQFTCEICGAGFEQKSRYERHMLTSHPQPAPTAADLERALKGVDFPKSRDELVAAVEGQGQGQGQDQGESDVAEIVRALPDQQYRDAAEVARAFGELRSWQKKPTHQPSKKGGAQAMKAPSAARITSIFSGINFPASGKELKQYARENAAEDELQTIEQFGDHTYRSMADVAKEIGKVS